MKIRHVLTGATLMAALHAETLRIVDLRVLTGPDAGEMADREINLTAMESAVGFPSVRLAGDATAYLAPPADRGERSWMTEQGALRVALRLPDDKPVEGLLYLRDKDDARLSAVAFTFDPSELPAASEEDFNAVRDAHFARLAGAALPGAAWFRHRSGTAPGERPGVRPQGLDDTFRLFTGSRAIAENLALDRELLLAEGVEGDPVALDSLKGVTVKAIDWSGKLQPGEVAVDPLSMLVPHDQHAVFLPSMANLFDLIDIVESEGAPILQTFDARNPYRGLAARYQRQMGLDVPRAIAAGLPVKALAITGGDPFFPSGTDMALLFETAAPDALFDALSAAITVKAKLRGATAREGPSGIAFETADRSFSSYLAKIGDAVVVANSPVQLQRLRSVADGATAALGSLDEFKFFRQRYPAGEAESAYLFLSDPTIRRWAGPRVRVAASRRTRAAAALGALTARRLDGQETGDEFAGLLGRIRAGEPIVRSEIHNTLGFLTPVSELDFGTVTAAEAAAYERWRDGYENGWAQVFDPIAIRLKVDERSREMDLSVMPLTVDSDYREWINITGSTRPERGAEAAHPGSPLFFSFAVDPESERFRQFGEWSFGMIPALKAQPLAWVGDSVSIYLDDGFFWKALGTGDAEELIRSNFLRIPLGARIASRSSARLAVFLAGLRGYIEQSAPGLLKWEQRKHGDQAYLAVLSGGESEPSMEGGIFYAALEDSLLLSLDEKVLQRAIDRAGKVVTTGNHLHAVVNPGFAAGLGSAFGTTLLERQRIESWSAIPILNEWRRLADGKDPLAFHARHFREEIHCPGGEGYRWNPAALTMESVVFGHPGDPRGEATALKLVEGFSRLQVGIDFEDDGLRLRAVMGRSRLRIVPAAAADPAIPEGFPQPRDLMPLVPGTRWKYRVTETWADEPYEKEITLTAATAGEEGIVLATREVSRPPGEDEPHQQDAEHLLGEGLFWMSARDEDAAQVFGPYMPILPARLAPGLPFGGEHRSERTDEDGVSREVGRVRGKVVGLETVTVPAGVFEGCVRIDGEYDYLTYGTIGRVTESTWFAPGVGVVKTRWKDDFDSGTEELEAFEMGPDS